MWKLYCFGAACPVLWVMFIVILVDSFKGISSYKSMKITSSKAKAVRGFIFSGIMLASAIIVTAQLVGAMKNL